MTQYLSNWTTHKLFSKNIFKNILNISFATKCIYSRAEPIDLLQINRKNMKSIPLTGQENIRIPIIGLGTWKAVDDDVYTAVLRALDIGYRHIDTAFNYMNEEQIGNAIKTWIDSGKGTREHLFITTKLPVFGNRSEDVGKFLNLSLNKLKVDYVDLYLIHMPFALQLNQDTLSPLLDKDGIALIDSYNDNLATWKVMEEQVKKGLVRSIGLSNFNAKQVQNIYDNSEIKPSVLQVEIHANLQQNELVNLCKRLNIGVTAYSPLGSPEAAQHFEQKYNYKIKTPESLMDNQVVRDIAKKYNKTSGQILLKHLTQKNIIVIPKSTNSKRIEENFRIFDFDLESEDMEKLNNLDKKEDGRRFDFLVFKGIGSHPHYPFKDRLKEAN